MPDPKPLTRASSDQEASSPEDLPVGTELPEEDAQSVIGVSISRAQTRLTSPQTPATEKVAVMEDLEGGGFFPGSSEGEKYGVDGTGHDNEAEEEEEEEEGSTPKDEAIPPSTPQEQPQSATLPSPWRAEPKIFEKFNLDGQRDSEPTSMLSDLNVRRYIASFNLPALPKTPSFKDFSVPSLSSILSNTRSHSPVRKDESRQKRSSTLDQSPSTWGFSSPFQSRPKPETSAREESLRGRPESTSPTEVSKNKSLQKAEQDVSSRSSSTIRRDRRLASDLSNHTPRPPYLRRTTSDQSLLLRRVTSTRSSLGDDSRWENVQEQVNSRMKAIKDSLQDSNIKLPSLPNLSTLNLNAFRPDFTRSRAQSETKRPIVGNGLAELDCATQVVDEKHASSARGFRDRTNAEGFQTNSKISQVAVSCLDEALENLTGDLVILGGYRGSILRSAQPPHRQLWVPVKVGLNIRKVNLEVGLDPEDEENMQDHIIASGMLSHIGPVDMGRRLLRRLKSCKNAVEGRLRVHDYGYDWRLSPHLLSRRLLAFLLELPCNGPDVPTHQRGATVIAHSMGGLITRHVVNRRPDLFAGVVYAGVPQHCVNILGPLRNGDEVLLSSKVLTAQVNFTLRGSFLLLPDDGKCFVNKETKEEYPVNFFDVEQWKEYAWSPCIAPALPPTNPQENKSILGSMTDMLPSMPSLPLPGRKTSSTVDAAYTKLNNLSNP